MRLNAGTVAAMGYLAKQGWTLRQFAETFAGGGDWSEVDPLVFTVDPGHAADGHAADQAGSEAFLRDRDPLADCARVPGLRDGSAAVPDPELDAGEEKAPGMAVPEGVGKDLAGLIFTTSPFYHRRRQRRN